MISNESLLKVVLNLTPEEISEEGPADAADEKEAVAGALFFAVKQGTYTLPEGVTKQEIEKATEEYLRENGEDGLADIIKRIRTAN